MSQGSAMPEVVQRINFNEITEVQVTCPRCESAIILPLKRCARPSLRCPACDQDLRGSSTENHLGAMAMAILKIQGESTMQQVNGLPPAAKHEFILKTPIQD